MSRDREPGAKLPLARGGMVAIKRGRVCVAQDPPEIPAEIAEELVRRFTARACEEFMRLALTPGQKPAPAAGFGAVTTATGPWLPPARPCGPTAPSPRRISIHPGEPGYRQDHAAFEVRLDGVRWLGWARADADGGWVEAVVEGADPPRVERLEGRVEIVAAKAEP